MIPGVDLLGVAQYQDTAYRALKVLGPRYALGFFARFPDGFGDPYPLVQRVAGEGITKVFRGHGSWDDGHHPERNFRMTIAEGRRYDALAMSDQSLKIYFSTGCEHHLGQASALKYAKRLAAECPHLTIVNNHDDANFLPGYINEIHGASPRKPRTSYIVSPDGTIIKDWNAYRRRFSDAVIRFWWAPHCNGNSGTGHDGPRKKRTRWPSEKEIIEGAYKVR